MKRLLLIIGWTLLGVWAVTGWTVVAIIAYRNASPAVVDCGVPMPKGKHG